MSTSFFTDRGFSPFGASLFGPNGPTTEQKQFFGLPGTTAYDSEPAKKNVWSGVLQSYKGANAPSSLNNWLFNQQGTEDAGYQLWRQSNPTGSFADYAALRDYERDWENLAPGAAGRSNFYQRYRVSGG